MVAENYNAGRENLSSILKGRANEEGGKGSRTVIVDGKKFNTHLLDDRLKAYEALSGKLGLAVDYKVIADSVDNNKYLSRDKGRQNELSDYVIGAGISDNGEGYWCDHFSESDVKVEKGRSGLEAEVNNFESVKVESGVADDGRKGLGNFVKAAAIAAIVTVGSLIPSYANTADSMCEAIPATAKISAEEAYRCNYNDKSLPDRAGFSKYTVKKGDSMWKIAKEKNIDFEDFKEANKDNIWDSGRIYAAMTKINGEKVAADVLYMPNAAAGAESVDAGASDSDIAAAALAVGGPAAIAVTNCEDLGIVDDFCKNALANSGIGGVLVMKDRAEVETGNDLGGNDSYVAGDTGAGAERSKYASIVDGARDEVGGADDFRLLGVAGLKGIGARVEMGDVKIQGLSGFDYDGSDGGLEDRVDGRGFIGDVARIMKEQARVYPNHYGNALENTGATAIKDSGYNFVNALDNIFWDGANRVYTDNETGKQVVYGNDIHTIGDGLLGRDIVFKEGDSKVAKVVKAPFKYVAGIVTGALSSVFNTSGEILAGANNLAVKGVVGGILADGTRAVVGDNFVSNRLDYVVSGASDGVHVVTATVAEHAAGGNEFNKLPESVVNGLKGKGFGVEYVPTASAVKVDSSEYSAEEYHDLIDGAESPEKENSVARNVFRATAAAAVNLGLSEIVSGDGDSSEINVDPVVDIVEDLEGGPGTGRPGLN